MKTIIKLLIALAVIAGAVYYSFNLVMTAVIHSKKEIAIPDVKGIGIAEALDKLSAAGFGMKKEGEEINQSVAPGLILRQSPPAGMNVKEGKVVKVTISRGGEMIYVPDLSGRTVRAADIALKSAKLMMGEISKKYSVTADKGIVLSQDPAAGTTADKDAVINLVISDGPPQDGTVLMPDWKNKSGEDAKAWAVKTGITVEMKSETSASVPAGMIVRQNPAPDSDLSKSDKVVFYIAAKAQDDKGGGLIFNYQVPDSGGSKRIRLVLSDDNGEKDLLNAVKKPGTKISIPIQASGKAKVTVYVNKVFVEDVELQ